MASLSQGRTAAAKCGLFTYKSVPVIFEPSCISILCREDVTYLSQICVQIFFFMPLNQNLSAEDIQMNE